MSNLEPLKESREMKFVMNDYWPIENVKVSYYPDHFTIEAKVYYGVSNYSPSDPKGFLFEKLCESLDPNIIPKGDFVYYENTDICEPLQAEVLFECRYDYEPIADREYREAIEFMIKDL